MEFFSTCDEIKMLKAIAIAKGFSLPAGFIKRSYARLQKVYNGIGAEWMPKFLRKFITWLLTGLEAAALVHDFEWSKQKKSLWHFLVSNLRLWYNAAKLRHFFSGGTAALICTIFGWSAYKSGKELP